MPSTLRLALPARPVPRGSCGSPIRGSRGPAEDQGPDPPAGRRSAGLAAHRPGGPAVADDVATAHDRVRRDQQPQRPATSVRYHAEQGGEHGPVRPVEHRSTRLPSLQDGELVAQDQDLGGLPRLLAPGTAAATRLVAWSGETRTAGT